MTEEVKDLQEVETVGTVETVAVEGASKSKKERGPGTDTKEPEANFDWNAYANDEVIPAEEKESLRGKYTETLSKVVEKEVIEGTVIAMNKREVVVNIGFKSDGIISLNEFRYNPDLKVGDKVEVYVETQEDKKGQLSLSHKQARALQSWSRVNEALESNEIIKGFVKCRTKGGMIVDVFGIEAFLPGSQIDVKPIRDYDIYVNKTMEFKVVKINNEFRNVVVSHKALIEAELEQQKKEIISKLEKGQVLEGIVKNITTYGVFIDLGGVDGLVHITDLSWGRVNHPNEIVQLDQKLNVVILDFDDEKKRIALGLKQLTPHPWDGLDPNLSVGDKVNGKVVVMAEYGAFVEIDTGIEGLIHVSEMSWSQHLRSAQDFMRVGDEVEAIILTLDRDERKMSLGIKQLKEDPWQTIDAKYNVGSAHKAIVRNFTNFGVFVEIEEGVDGLIHISDLSWTKKVKHPAEFTQIGAMIDVVVLETDRDSRRLSLGHKQLEENPWDIFETLFTVDSIHEGTITELFDKGAVIALPYGVEGFATPRHLVKEDGVQAKADEKLEFKVIEFNKAAKRIILSHSRVFEDVQRAEERSKKEAEANASQKELQVVVDKVEKTTLGDVTDLAALKETMTQEEADKPKKDGKKPKAKVAQVEGEAAIETQAEKEAQVEGEAAIATQTQAEKEAEKAETEAPEVKKTKSKPKAEAESKPKAKAESKPKAKAESKPKAKAKAKAEESEEVVTEAKPKTTRKPKAKAEVPAETETEADK
ncbi:30S ribosomal protein S1 [Bacteroidia bacterium]|nr:30S ribosomal protein S1 [Bacteroidia bacterium]